MPELHSHPSCQVKNGGIYYYGRQVADILPNGVLLHKAEGESLWSLCRVLGATLTARDGDYILGYNGAYCRYYSGMILR